MAGPNAKSSSWVRRLGSSATARARLICFPHAGGAASWYVPLARALVPTDDPAAVPRGGWVDTAVGDRRDVEVVAVQYPGRQDRLAEPAVDSMDGLVAAVVPELDGWLDRPFGLFGHSMGAIVAFEVAVAMAQRTGPVPAGLFVSGRRAPSTWRDDRIHRGGDGSLLRDLTRLAGTPAELMEDDDVRQMVLPALRADYKAIETYAWQPGPPLQCPIHALVGEADPLTTQHEAAAWSAHTSGDFQLHSFPGGHFYLTDHVPEVAGLVARTLAGAGGWRAGG